MDQEEWGILFWTVKVTKYSVKVFYFILCVMYIFTGFGNVVELRINTKGVGGKLPNFGFVVFDDSEPVQRILIAKVSDLNGIIEYLIIPVVFNVNKSFLNGTVKNSLLWTSIYAKNKDMLVILKFEVWVILK